MQYVIKNIALKELKVHLIRYVFKLFEREGPPKNGNKIEKIQKFRFKPLYFVAGYLKI